MTTHAIVIVQQGARASAGAQAAADAQASALQSAQDAQQAARDAGDAARDAARSHRDIKIVSGDGKTITIPGGTFDALPGMMGGTGVGPFEDVIPRRAVDIAYGFFTMCTIMVVGWPLARALGRRIERRGEVATLSPAVSDQLVRIEQAVDAMSIEVERISESQRFLAKLQQPSSTERV